MNIILINAPWINNDVEYGVKSGARWAMVRKKDRTMPFYAFPFYLAYAASYLQSKGFNVMLRDSIAIGETKEQALDFINKAKADFVLIETSTPSIFYDFDFCDSIKKMLPEITVALCGPHVTALPEEGFKKSKADYILTGEYEKALLDLVKSIEEKKDFSSIKGIAYNSGGKIIVNERAELFKNLDDLPFPIRNKDIIHKYNEPSCRNYPNLPVMTSRGCPFKCIFCLESKVFYGKPQFRFRSMENVMQEIELLINDYQVKEIFFDDTYFPLNRAKELAESILKKGFSVCWSCWIDRGASKDLLQLMKKAGCSGVKFGVESFSPDILKNAHKSVEFQQVNQLVKNCKKLGLFTHASYMFGLPGETKGSMDLTIKKAFELKTTTSQFSIATPLPGTDFYNIVKENGWLITDDWSKYEGAGTAVVAYPGVTAFDIEEGIKRVRKKKIISLISNPLALFAFLLKLLKMKGFTGLLKEIFSKMGFLFRK